MRRKHTVFSKALKRNAQRLLLSSTLWLMISSFLMLFSFSLYCGFSPPKKLEKVALATAAPLPIMPTFFNRGINTSLLKKSSDLTEKPPLGLQNNDTATAFSTEAQAPTVTSASDYGIDTSGILCLMQNSGVVEQLSLEQYVLGALLAEMPSSFEHEALCAQAIACRTYALYNMQGASRHKNGAEICTSASHCQAYCEPTSVDQTRLEKASAAVNATSGVVMLYNQAPILAVYHSSSGQKTKSSAEVWGGGLDYLVSVESPEGAVMSFNTEKSYYFSVSELYSRLGLSPDDGFSVPQLIKTSSGLVTEVVLGDKTLEASHFAAALSLRSRDFDISAADNDGISITCHGYGHGVGLSQYGAQALALDGKSRYEILSHYYTGIEFALLQ